MDNLIETSFPEEKHGKLRKAVSNRIKRELQAAIRMNERRILVQPLNLLVSIPQDVFWKILFSYLNAKSLIIFSVLNKQAFELCGNSGVLDSIWKVSQLKQTTNMSTEFSISGTLCG